MSPAPDAPFVRFSRDNRGYEYVYLVHVPSARGVRSRILYWFRTPPGVKVGREPFDLNLQRALETQYPDLYFDWKAIAQAQAPPPPEVEHWRERRRAEKSAKQARQAAARDDQPADASNDPEEPPDAEPGQDDVVASTAAEAAATPDTDATPAAPLADGQRRRRRRRRGGRGRSAATASIPAEMPADSLVPAEPDQKPEEPFENEESGTPDPTS